MTDLAHLNIALCHALGVTNTDLLTTLTLEIRAGQLPKLTAVYSLLDAGALREVVDKHALAPKPARAAPSEVA